MDNLIFYFFSALLLFSAFKTITHKSSVSSALYLAVSMMATAGLFYVLGAHFLAGVQIAVYAGAVIVLFVMVLMLFDLKSEIKQNVFKNPIRWSLPIFLLGILSGTIYFLALSSHSEKKDLSFFSAKNMALKLFTKHIFLFEMLGFLLLLIAVGIVILVRLDREDS